jgi:hypothetical protein
MIEYLPRVTITICNITATDSHARDAVKSSLANARLHVAAASSEALASINKTVQLSKHKTRT